MGVEETMFGNLLYYKGRNFFDRKNCIKFDRMDDKIRCY